MERPYQVDVDRLDELVARLRGLSEFVGDDLDELERRIVALHESWTGRTAEAHARAHREWRAGADDVRDGLSTMQDVVGRAHTAFAGVAEVNARIFRR